MREIVSPLAGIRSPFGFIRGGGVVPFSPSTLFASGEEGAWYEPSTTTCFTDTGGTTPATYGDGVAYLQDLSGNGNHATQVTAGARPILARVPEGGRRNLLEKTEQFDDAYWTEINLNVDGATGYTDPLGGNTADLVTHSSSVGNLNRSITLTATAYSLSFYLRYSNSQWVRIGYINSSTNAAWFDIQNGVEGSVVGAGNSSVIEPVGGGWYRCTLVISSAVATSQQAFVSQSNSDGSTTSTASGSFYLWGAQLEAGSTATAYQKVVDEYDVTEAGVTSLDYLSFDGSDDGMATASIDFTATDKMSVFAGVESEADAANAIIEMGNRYFDKNGAFACFRVPSGAYSYSLSTTTSSDNGFSNTTTSVYAAPSLSVLSFGKDLAGATEADKSVFSRVNGASDIASTLYSAPSTATAFLNLPLNIGARNNAASIWFDGKIFGLIVRGAASTAQEISDTEAYLAAKSGVTL